MGAPSFAELFFAYIDVVSGKNPKTCGSRQGLVKFGTERFVMNGNLLRSEVEPPVDCIGRLGHPPPMPSLGRMRPSTASRPMRCIDGGEWLQAVAGLWGADSACGIRQNRCMSFRLHAAGSLLFVLLLVVGIVAAQDTSVSVSAFAAAAPAEMPASGDVWVDRQLLDIDRYAVRYPDSFLDEVARYAQMPRGYAEALLRECHWPARDIYFAGFLATATGRPYREVVRARSATGAQAGWAEVATGLQAPPGSLAYRALRHAIVASYDHWDRPIVLDALLRRQLGGRAAAQP